MGKLKEFWNDLMVDWGEVSPIVQTVVIIVALVFLFGILGPSLVSSNSTAAVWIGILICVSSSIALWEMAQPIIKKLKGE